MINKAGSNNYHIPRILEHNKKSLPDLWNVLDSLDKKGTLWLFFAVFEVFLGIQTTFSTMVKFVKKKNLYLQKCQTPIE